MDQVANLLDRPKQYYNIDGVGELGIGFMCLSYALLEWLQIRSPEHSVWNQVYMPLVFIGVMCAVIHYGSRAIKEHITYPRTGFVSYRRRDAVWLPMIFGALASALIAAVLGIGIRRHWSFTTPASLFGLFLAAGYGFRIARTVRWKWLVAILMALGSLLLALLPEDVTGAPARHSWVLRIASAKLAGTMFFNMALYGGLLFVSGAISFCLYLRNTQPPGAETP